MTAIQNPQLERFYESNPQLRPDRPKSSAQVPAWYDNSVVELAGAVLASRWVVGRLLAARDAPPVDQVQAVAGQAWRHNAPAWLQFAVPAIKQTYAAGRVQGLSDAELDAMATDYAEGLGDYLSETSGDALAEGFQSQLMDRWDSNLAWHRVTAAYGLDKPDMRNYIRTVLAQPKESRDPIGTGARMLVDRALVARADHVAQTEVWTASQAGLATSWLIRQQRGEIGPDARRRWRTRRGERVCEICLPLDGTLVRLDQPFVTVTGVKLWGPSAHPGCQCSQELVEEISKAKQLADGDLDPYDRDPRGRFADREYRTRDVTHLATPTPLSPEVQQIVDEAAAAVRDPFGMRSDDPFATPGDPFRSTSDPFAMKAADPFAAKSPDPFASDPFAMKVPKPRKKVQILHIFMPKKKTEDSADYERSANSYYLPYDEFTGVYEHEGYAGLIQPGDRYDFDQAASDHAESAYYSGSMDETESALYEAERNYHLADIGTHRIFEAHGFDGGKVPPRFKEAYSLVASRSDSPWDAVKQNEVRSIWLDDRDAETHWDQIQPVAKRIYDEAMDNPLRYVDQLSRAQLDWIYNMAGYERGEDDLSARDRIVDAVESRGIGDDSLAESFADHVVWSGDIDTGSNGEELGRLLESAADDDLPDLRDDWRGPGVEQVFTFERGLHPETMLRSNDRHADLEGHYVVSHAVYRSNLGENGSNSVPFVTGVREAFLWPADDEGHPLHGGPYDL